MSAGATTGASVSSAPRSTPLTGIGSIGIEVAVWIIALDVGKVEEDLVVRLGERTDLVVASVEVSVGTGAVQVTRHVHEDDVRVLRLQLRHGVQVGIDTGFGIIGHTTTPRPCLKQS